MTPQSDWAMWFFSVSGRRIVTGPSLPTVLCGFALAIVLAGSGCGSGSSSSKGTNSAVTSISVSCNPATVNTGAVSQCSADVQGTGAYNSTVVWSASAGTITADGSLTAPSVADNVTVTATSTQDNSKSGVVTVSVQEPTSTITSVSVSCNPSTIAPSATSQCSATVQGTGNFNSAVDWSVSSGSITAAGLLTAPSTAGSITVSATSKQDSSKTGTVTVAVQIETPRSRHIVWVMEENQDYSKVVNNNVVWPNLNALIAQGALPTNYYANTHPSIGNYFMLTTGQILTNNDNSTVVWNVDNIARRMLAANISFRIYAEGISHGYTGGDTGLYLIRHNPFAMLSDIANNSEVANAVIWPFSQFASDLANGNLPEFSYIVPNIDDDAHTGTPQQADSWLQTNVIIPLSNNPAFRAGGDGVLIINFDEAKASDATHGGGHIAPVLWGPAVKAGFQQVSPTLYQHQSMLATMMELMGLSDPPGAARTAPLMNKFFANQ